jgi:FlaA1/EpsC-like NDP-sugar epimerase
VKNNVRGTRIVCAAAARYRAERFILISSDKAVNPTSVMGTTKAIAERIVRRTGVESSTACAAVRLGNVLGSNASVVPKFRDQIRDGGPVTVTHPDVKRYFMLIPEAVQLVLHAAAMADVGGLFVLDMGEQIKLLDLARDLIRLSGFIPDDEIPITFTGLRPGEKLYEELAGSDETLTPSAVEKILIVHQESEYLDRLWLEIAALEHAAEAGDVTLTLFLLQQAVPSFQSSAVNRTVATC